MGDKSHIEWTDATWNPIRGCSLVSAGCTNCYAMKQAHRFSGINVPGGPYKGLTRMTSNGPVWTGEVQFVEAALAIPLRWRLPRRIFVNSMSDLFHEGLSDEDILRIFQVMHRCPQHIFQVLTKRPKRMQDFCARLRFDAEDSGRLWLRDENLGYPFTALLKHCWLGVSVEDQKTADERIPWLLKTPAAIRWVSYEPALGPVNFCAVPDNKTRPAEFSARYSPLGDLNWIVAGGESGPRARPSQPEWFQSVRDQCVAAGVPFFFKQWGEYAPIEFDECDSHVDMEKVGKKAAGRILDGRTWDEYPKQESAL